MHLRLLAAAVTAGLALSACSDDPEPILTPTPTETPSTTTTSPTPTESAEQEDPKEFIRRWSELGTEMQNTGETTAFLSTAHKSCRPCHDIAELVKGYYDAGGYVKTDGWTIKSIRALNPGKTELAGFIVNVRSAPTEVKKSTSDPPEELPGGPLSYQFTLTMREGRWLVTDFAVRAV